MSLTSSPLFADQLRSVRTYVRTAAHGKSSRGRGGGGGGFMLFIIGIIFQLLIMRQTVCVRDATRREEGRIFNIPLVLLLRLV